MFLNCEQCRGSHHRIGGITSLLGDPPSAFPRHVAAQGRASMLGGLAKARHPAAKAAAQAPAKQGAAKKRSCYAGKPMCMRTSEGEDASLRKEAPALAPLRDGPAKKQRPAEGPRALPLRPIPACKRHCELRNAPCSARRRTRHEGYPQAPTQPQQAQLPPAQCLAAARQGGT